VLPLGVLRALTNDDGMCVCIEANILLHKNTLHKLPNTSPPSFCEHMGVHADWSLKVIQDH